MKKATFTLTFNRKKRLNKEGKGSVEAYCYVGGRAKFVGTGVNILPFEWDSKKRVVARHPNATKLNIMLAGMLNKLEDYELSIHNERGEFIIDDLKKFSFNGDGKNNFIDWLQKEIEEDNTVAPGTRAYRFNMLDKLTDVSGKDLHVSRVNYELIKKFNNYMASQGLTSSTQSKLHNQLRKFISIAVHEGVLKKNPYDLYKVKKPVYSQKKVLWFSDLDRIWELKYPQDSDIEIARLKFLFSCYTGLRISDTNLCWDQVREGKLFVKMQKTARPVVIPINVLGDRAQSILDQARRLSGGSERVFPYLHDQRVNTCLKSIGADAGVSFPLTFHMARHTFCTIVAHHTGSVFEVMRFSGISKIETALVYINLNKMYSLSESVI